MDLLKPLDEQKIKQLAAFKADHPFWAHGSIQANAMAGGLVAATNIPLLKKYVAPVAVLGSGVQKAFEDPMMSEAIQEAKKSLVKVDAVSMGAAVVTGGKILAEHMPKEVVMRGARDTALSVGAGAIMWKCMAGAATVIATPPVQAAVVATGPAAPFVEVGLIVGAGLSCGYAAYKGSEYIKEATNPHLPVQLTAHDKVIIKEVAERVAQKHTADATITAPAFGHKAKNSAYWKS